MLTLVSPAKKLDFSPLSKDVSHTQCDFLERSRELVGIASELTKEELQSLMELSPKLAQLNWERFQSFEFPFDCDNARPAALAFRGDTYVGLDADTLEEADWTFAQDHLRILSGLYGLLRPLDLMQPYRLEMGRKLTNPKGHNLYAYWGSSLAEAVDGISGGILVNCASNEYFKALDKKALKSRVVTPVFKEIRNGQAKVIGLMAKKARGMMARHIIRNRLDVPEPLKEFTAGGYAFQPELSTEDDWVFTREA